MGLILCLILFGDKVKVENDDRCDVVLIYCFLVIIVGVEGVIDKLN